MGPGCSGPGGLRRDAVLSRAIGSTVGLAQGGASIFLPSCGSTADPDGEELALGERGMEIEAVLFDMDGVLTDTARIHAVAWQATFDAFLRRWAESQECEFEPFDPGCDYLTHVDGKARADGVRDFLRSRSIELPEDATSDDSLDTVASLAACKDGYFADALARAGAELFPGSRRFVEAVRRAGIRTAVVSASRHCREILELAGALELFDQRVDGVVAAADGLRGKPDPGTFLAAAARLGVAPQRAVVIEDAVAGVQAGRSGDFCFVVGVARHGNGQALREHGAHVVVTDLADLLPAMSDWMAPLARSPGSGAR